MIKNPSNNAETRGMRTFLIVLIACVVLGDIAAVLWAGSKVVVGSEVAASEQVSIDQVSHELWEQLLRRYCDTEGYVNYRAWKASDSDQQQLDAYLSQLSQANPKLPANRNKRLAFWINAYNAVTIRGILREYPTSSIKDHQSLTFGYKIWDDLLLIVGEQHYSLNQIEHEILRKMSEPRIHFAIVCASIGCPPLRNQAYIGEKLDVQLADNARKFFAEPSKFYVDEGGTLHLSKILSWFGTDFGKDRATMLQALSAYLPNEQARRLAQTGTAKISFLEYDWRLNDRQLQN